MDDIKSSVVCTRTVIFKYKHLKGNERIENKYSLVALQFSGPEVLKFCN